MGTRRDIVGLTGNYTFGDWTITGAVRDEHKEGTVEESLRRRGYIAGQAFTLPVDYDTHRYDVSAAYSTAAAPGRVRLLPLQLHRQQQRGLPSQPGVWDGETRFAVTALYATPPSNYAQYVTAMIGYNMTPGTRINVNARYGLETQNDTYPANTGDPADSVGPFGRQTHLNSLGQGTSATSPDIMAQVYQGNVGISSNSFSNFNASAKYSIDGRNVSIDQAGPVYGNGPSGWDSSATNSAYAYVVPQEWLKQKVNARRRLSHPAAKQHQAVCGLSSSTTSTAATPRSATAGPIPDAGLSSMLGSSPWGASTAPYAERTGVVNLLGAVQNLADRQQRGQWPAAPSVAYYQAPYTMEAVERSGPTTLRPRPFSGGLSFKSENDNYQDPAAPRRVRARRRRRTS